MPRGKAFQAWEAALAAAAAAWRGLLAGEFRGRCEDKGAEKGGEGGPRNCPYAYVPHEEDRQAPIARVRQCGLLTELALDLHGFRCNGVDPTGTLSRYVDLKDVEGDVVMLTAEGRKFVDELKGRAA